MLGTAESIQEQYNPNVIKLTVPQSRFFKCKAKYVAFVGGFGSGKSQSLFLRMLNDKFEDPEANLLYGAPTYGLIRDIAHDRLCAMLDTMPVSYKLNKADQYLEIGGFGKILFRSLDRPERIVGFEIKNAYLDELDTLKTNDAEEVWNKIIARARQRTRRGGLNRIFVATTPEGFRFVYRRWKKNPLPEYVMINAPTSSNQKHLPADYVDSLKDTYPAHLIDAYLEGEFVNLLGQTVYANFDRIRNYHKIEVGSDEDIHIGCDFNVRNMSATCHVIREDKVFAFNELTKLKDTPDLINTINELYKFDGHRIFVYPDATGEKNTSQDASQSDIRMLKDANFIVKAKRSNPPVKDRVKSMNAAFLNGKNEIRYFVDTDACPEYTDALEQQVYGKNGLPEKRPDDNVDDLNDSAGYFIYNHWPIQRRQFTTHHVANY